MWRNGTWSEIWKIQAFTEVNNVNVNINIHELESTLKPSYKFINPGGSAISIFLIFRNSYHYNQLILKKFRILIKTINKKEKEPKISKNYLKQNWDY